MTKYSEEFKIKLVTEYLHGNLGYESLAKKYNIPSKTPLLYWVRAFKAQGVKGLERKKAKEVYSVQFKLDTIQFILETGASYQDTADHFRLNTPSLIHRWMKRFDEQGIEGLKPKSKELPSMSQKPDIQKKGKKKELTREAELERENELLRLENAYLKKLKAFRENSNASLGKRKQNWHSNSKKKDFD